MQFGEEPLSIKMEDSLESVRNMKFSKTVMVLQIISADNGELLEAWEMLHREVIRETYKSRCYGWMEGIFASLGSIQFPYISILREIVALSQNFL